MRKAAFILLLLYAFAIPWEYSLDLGEPYGNIARILGLALFAVTIPAAAKSGALRPPRPLHVFILALFLWFCCTSFWTIDPHITLEKLRGYLQEMMIVWMAWEFIESPRYLHAVLRAWLAGTWVLAALTIASWQTSETIAEGRFAAFGQDPNDVARFLDLGFPIAALLLSREERWPARLLAISFFPLGVGAVLLTASRGGVIAAAVALTGSLVLLLQRRPQAVLAGAFASPLLAVLAWLVIPRESFDRLATIPAQLQAGDWNQRFNIWQAGWRAYAHAPFFGHGAGSFVSAAGLAPIDTAHNTALSLLVETGICGFALAFAILILAFRAALQASEAIRPALITLLLTWLVSSLVGTVVESRTTWLMFSVIACAARLHDHEMDELNEIGKLGEIDETGARPSPLHAG